MKEKYATDDIITLIGQHVKLGALIYRAYGPCPGHESSDMALAVDPDLGLWRCRECGASGGYEEFKAFVGAES